MPSAANIRKFLIAADSEYLADLLLSTFRASPATKQKILLDMADQGDGGPNVSAYREMIKKTIGSNTFVDYYKMPTYAKNASDLIERIGSLLNRNRAADARDLAAYAIEHAVETASQSDNSDGYMFGIVHSLLDIHFTACRAAPPDPLVLARLLFTWDMCTIMDVDYVDVEDEDGYDDVLGEVGKTEFRRLVEEAWAKFLAEGEKRDFSEYRLKELMQGFAVSDGDFEGLIALQKQDATSAYGYAKVANTYASVQQMDQAIAWMESAFGKLPEREHSTIRGYLIGLHQKVGDHELAMELAWKNFSEDKSYRGYTSLREVALISGVPDEVRTKALDAMRSNLIDRKKRTTNPYYRSDFSDLVRIYLEEDQPEHAWQAAQEGGCDARTALRLAELREGEHPEDALRIYRAQFENQIQHANGDYRAEVGLLQAMNRVMKRLGCGAEFNQYLAKTSEEYKRRKNFLLRIKQADWSGN